MKAGSRPVLDAGPPYDGGDALQLHHTDHWSRCVSGRGANAGRSTSSMAGNATNERTIDTSVTERGHSGSVRIGGPLTKVLAAIAYMGDSHGTPAWLPWGYVRTPATTRTRFAYISDSAAASRRRRASTFSPDDRPGAERTSAWAARRQRPCDPRPTIRPAYRRMSACAN